ncbi:aminotransferase class I/II-fold pyridoxal phosphate-dependent enzyme [Candidatus Peregrinibacteria bacterium]|nr:aminotransferase class I/II-fold pyridoxal phosphate-dependent enzyme [Candidatus Peregrinibacteria bacterium]
MSNLQTEDQKVFDAIEKEKRRQVEGLELIPSENYVSGPVLECLGSVLTNKYSEGYSGKRYYGGCENVDTVETLAIERAKSLFNAEHVNVQPLSGAPANIAVYSAVLKEHDTVIGMDLSHGGHLTHGHPVTWMAKLFNFPRYKTKKDTGEIDYEEMEELAIKHNPKLLLVGYSAYSRDIDYERVQAIADKVGAITMADIAHIAGLIAAGEMNNPVPIFDIVTTTTHKTLRGPRGGMIMCKEKYAKKIDKAVFPGLQGGPHENNIAAKAVAFLEDSKPEYKQYALQVKKNAKQMQKKFKEKGYEIMFKGTENHLLLIDVTNKGITGSQAQEALDDAGITLNKNMIPDDQRSPMDPSGIRLGTPAITTRGMKEAEMDKIVDWIDRVITNIDDHELHKTIKEEVKEMCLNFPVPGIKI